MSQLVLFYAILSSFIWLVGYFHNGRLVRPKWKVPGKFLFYIGTSTLLAYFFQHYALIFILIHPLIGLYFHTKICREHHINWWTCQPEEKYLELQERWAKGDFGKQDLDD